MSWSLVNTPVERLSSSPIQSKNTSVGIDRTLKSLASACSLSTLISVILNAGTFVSSPSVKLDSVRDN